VLVAYTALQAFWKVVSFASNADFLAGLGPRIGPYLQIVWESPWSGIVTAVFGLVVLALSSRPAAKPDAIDASGISIASEGIRWVWRGAVYNVGRAIPIAQCPEHALDLLYRENPDKGSRERRVRPLQVKDYIGPQYGGMLFCPMDGQTHELSFQESRTLEEAKERASPLLTQALHSAGISWRPLPSRQAG